MVGELNGTKAIIQIDFGDGFFNTVGQIEFNSSINANLIDISNKSYSDYVALLDGELSSRQISLTGNIFYNSDQSYRKCKEAALLGQIFTILIIDLNQSEAFYEYDAIISNITDNLGVGDGLSSSITFVSSFKDLSLSRGEMILYKSSEGTDGSKTVGFRLDGSLGSISNNEFIGDYGQVISLLFERDLSIPFRYFGRFEVDRQLGQGRLTPQALEVQIGTKKIDLTYFNQQFWSGNPDGNSWQNRTDRNNVFDDELLAPASGAKIMCEYLIANYRNGDKVSFSVKEAKPQPFIVDTLLNVGESIDNTPSEEGVFLGFENGVYGSLTYNYYSAFFAMEIIEMSLKRLDNGDYGFFSMFFDAGLGVTNPDFMELIIGDDIFWLSKSDDYPSEDKIFNSSPLSLEKIYAKFNDSLGQNLRIKVKGLPSLGGLCSFTTDKTQSGNTEKIGYSISLGSKIDDDISEFTFAQPKLREFYCEIDQLAKVGKIFLQLTGNIQVSPRGDEFTVLRVILDNQKELILTIAQSQGGSFLRNQYQIFDYNKALDLYSYLEQAENENRSVIMQCNSDNNEEFVFV